ncbi:MAG TPA: hypothetical protein VF803_03750, partial [Candidatus Paceibacterota bacterium]
MRSLHKHSIAIFALCIVETATLLFAAAPVALAAATVTLATGGSAISADTNGTNGTGVYTALAGPTVTEGASGDIHNGTIILNVPTGFVFSTAAGSVTATVDNFNNCAANQTTLLNKTSFQTVTPTATTITVSVTRATSGGCKDRIIWSGIAVRPTAGTPLASGNVTKSGTSGITGVTTSTNFGTLTEVPGALDHFSFAALGTQAAGVSFNVVMTAQDAFNNTATGFIGSVDLTTNAGIIAPVQSGTFTSGVRTESVTVSLAGSSKYITATDPVSGKSSTTNTFTVNPGAFAKLQILVPGETAAPGTVTGKTGAPTAQTVGAPLSVTVNAVDSNWNAVSSTDTVRITSSDVNATLPSNAALVGGTKNFSVTLNTAGGATLTAADVTNVAITADTSPSITVNPATTTTALSSSGSPAVYGTSVIFTATVTPSTSGSPSGAVVFKDGAAT